MSDVIAIAIITSIPAVLASSALLVTAFRTNRKVDAVGVAVEAVHKEVKTINAQSIAQLADATETRRIAEVQIEDRTELEKSHMRSVNEMVGPQGI